MFFRFAKCTVGNLGADRDVDALHTHCVVYISLLNKIEGDIDLPLSSVKKICKKKKSLPTYPPQKLWVGAPQTNIFLMMALCILCTALPKTALHRWVCFEQISSNYQSSAQDFQIVTPYCPLPLCDYQTITFHYNF